MRGKTPHHGRRRLRLPRHVEHQHDGKIKMRGEIGGGAAPARGAAGAIEQAHDAFDDKNIRAVGRLRGEGIEQMRAASPRNRD